MSTTASTAATPPAKIEKTEVEERLVAACDLHLDSKGRLEGLSRLTGGASQETWSFDYLSEGGSRHPLILRRNARSKTQKLSSATEYRVVETAGQAGVLVPRVVFLLSPADELGNGYVMERVEGETIARKILRDSEYAKALPRMASQAGRILAQIHALDVSSIEGIPGAGATQHAALRLIDEYRALIDDFAEPHPAFELALRWLHDEMPPQEPATLVHGDFRNGNFIVTSEGIASILDWELAHLGDPIEDLGWLCVKSWRFGVSQKEVGGFGGIEDLCSAYRKAGGRDVDPERVKYWIVMGTMRWGVICQAQAFAHRSGMSRSVELAAIGRRVCETEWDLLDLIA